MMETYNMDRILSETPAWWNMAMAWTGSDSSLVEKPSYREKHPTNLQDIEERRQQEGEEDGCVEPTEPAPTTPEEVETCVGGRYPTKNTPNTRAPGHLSGRLTRSVRKSNQSKTKPWHEHLTGLIGWWRRVEQEQEIIESVRKKEELLRRKEGEGRKTRSDAKVSFLQKYYPDANSTPGGTCKLRRRSSAHDEINTLVLAKPCSGLGIGGNYSENGFPRTSSQETNIQLSSPIKKQRTGFRTKLLFWKQKDNPGGSYLAGQSGGSMCTMEETMDMAGAGEKVE
jgi:hypothetical protein